ncbi:MAG: tRNA pseudouridine(54/55) synthase Pus10 [Candidatus Micrarchaeota archaeon]|nr:tRNA pseudouridine(54/55) synthase Pus10 [Candidatus Micrarchaeota archaeon]
MAVPLCRYCRECFSDRKAFKEALAGAECALCRGAFLSLEKLVSDAVARSKSFEWETFAVSSSVPSECTLREQQLLDAFEPRNFNSVKNILNKNLIALLLGSTNKKHDPRFPDAVFEFNFSSQSCNVYPSNIFFFGHYIKLSRNFCQSRWYCKECRGKGCKKCGNIGANFPSVEEAIGKPLAQLFGAQDFILHASGREDVDVRCLGNGRPFVLELVRPAKRKADLQSAIANLNSDIRIADLKAVNKGFVDVVCNSHFVKEYIALVSASRPLTEQDAKKAEELSGVLLYQKTPTRVLSRRSDLERKRKILSISASCLGDGRLKLHIVAEAGTYIKEFISSDGGRTVPSISSHLGCSANCDELDVVRIHDYFLQTVKTN